MKNIIDAMPEYSDTELRILLVVMHCQDALSIADLQRLTGRKRQVYVAIDSLLLKGIVERTNVARAGEKAWIWKCIYTPPADEIISVPEIPVPEIPVPEIPVPEIPVPEIPVPEPKAKSAKGRKKKEVTETTLPLTPQQHPAVLAYVDITRRRPKQVVAEHIAKMVDDSVESITKWTSTVQQYVLNGWNPLNVANMIRMYRGELTVNSGGKRSTAITHQSPEQARSEWMDYLMEND